MKNINSIPGRTAPPSLYLILILMLTVLLPQGRGLAEIIDLSSEELQQTATEIVTGTVAAIYTRHSNEGDWEYIRYLAEIRVDQVEKSRRSGQADNCMTAPLYVRYWQRRWVGSSPQPPSTSGHRSLPAEGRRYRFYLSNRAFDGFSRQNMSGGYNVLLPNGFEKLEDVRSASMTLDGLKNQ